MPYNLDHVPSHPMEKGFYKHLAHPYVFIDECIQIWSDIDFATLNGHAVTASYITAFRPDDGPGNALEAIAAWCRIPEACDGVHLAFTAADIVAAKHQGQAAIVMTSQGGDFLGQNIHRLKAFPRLGLRMMISAYNSRSALGDGCLEAANFGVTNWGPLNIGADMTARPTLAHFLDALDYMIDKVGIDHVDIGTSMRHGTYPDGDLVRNRPAAATGRYAKHVEGNLRSRLRHVDGFDDYGQLLDVAEAMHKRGLGQADVEKVLGGNWLRVFEQVWGGFA